MNKSNFFLVIISVIFVSNSYGMEQEKIAMQLQKKQDDSKKEQEKNKEWEEKVFVIQNKLLALDKEKRAQLCQKGDVYRGKVYEFCCQSLVEKKQKLKELKLGQYFSVGEYAVYKAYFRSCPNRGAPYPMLPGQKWRDCPSCYSIFKRLNSGTQQCIFQKKLILSAKWNLHVMYGNRIKLSNYYYDIDNPQNDLMNCALSYHGLKECEKKKLEELLSLKEQ
jgi:hypothetical protein